MCVSASHREACACVLVHLAVLVRLAVPSLCVSLYLWSLNATSIHWETLKLDVDVKSQKCIVC